MPNFGIIDCGSNTVRLCIYKVARTDRETFTKKDFTILLNHKVMAGLAAHIEDGVMTDRGIAKAADAISDHLRSAAFFKCARLDITATAFLRNCSNSKAAKAAIEQAVGAPITLLSAADEAHLGFVGACCATSLEAGTLMDIGGGSTELTRIAGGNDSDNISIPQGSLSSYAQHVAGVFPNQDEARAICDDFRAKLQALPAPDHYHNDEFFGVGGSVRALAKVYADLFGAARKPTVLTLAMIEQLIDAFTRDSAAFAHSALRVTPDRVHTIVPGCLLAHTALELFGAQEIRICKCGLREGYLIDRILCSE